MPWLLDTAIDVGDLDAQPYQEIQIARFYHDSARFVITTDLEYGNTVDGTWVSGIPPKGSPTTYVVAGWAYTDLVTHAIATEGENVYAAVKRTLYDHLRAKNVIGPGHIV